MVNIFYNANLLPNVEFNDLISYKDNVVNKRDKSVIIQENGEVDVTDDRKTFMGSILNYQFTIEGFEPYIGSPFISLMHKIKDWLESNSILDPKPYMVRCYRNNQNTLWHRHGVLSNTSPKNHWVVIYYMHPNWDMKYGGKLNVSLVESEPMYSFDTTSNSIICHNGYYGHSVNDIKLGYEGNRDLFLSHWVTKQLT